MRRVLSGLSTPLLAMPELSRTGSPTIMRRPRTREMKEQFYRLAVEEIEKRCGIPPSDVMINFITVTDEDWSFGHGRAQFLTGEL